MKDIVKRLLPDQVLNVYINNLHKRTRNFQFRLILFLYIGSFLENKPEDVLKVFLKLFFGNYTLHRLLTDETNVQSHCYIKQQIKNVIERKNMTTFIPLYKLGKSKNIAKFFPGNSHPCCEILCVQWSSTYVLIYPRKHF